MNRQSVETAIDASLQRLRDHPFVVAAHADTLTEQQAQRWVMCAGRESRSFPDVLRNTLVSATVPQLRVVLQHNLDDELGNGNPAEAHFRHYLRLLHDVGISQDQFLAYRERAGIQFALSLAYNVSSGAPEAVALGYMLVNEAITPITYGAAKQAFARYYPALVTEFFDLHVTVDDRHVADLYTAVDAEPDDGVGDILYGVAIGERGMAVLLDEALGLLDHLDSIPTYTS
ncbi:MAG: iron-containing redox enzyme family protein [Thermoanaerobaculia bacterium]